MKIKEICLCCYDELEEGRNVKKNYHTPICDKCRPIIQNYLMNKDKIDRTIRARAVKMGGG